MGLVRQRQTEMEGGLPLVKIPKTFNYLRLPDEDVEVKN
jgi:hypothetical protein